MSITIHPLEVSKPWYNKYKNNFDSSNGGSGSGGMVEITYAELKELRDNAKLVPGAKYRMIDYETVVLDYAFEYNRDEYKMESYGIAAEKFPFDLILTAIDENNLDERCNAIWSERDVDGYFANSNLLAWDVRYSIDSYKYIWSAEHNATLILFDYYFGDFVKGYLDIPMSEKYHSQIFKIPVLSNKEYTAYAVPANDGNANIVAVYEDGREENIGGMSFVNIDIKQGKGTIYRLTDEHNNSCPYDFKNFKVNYENNFEFTFGSENDPVDVSTVYNKGNVNNNYIGERNYYGYRSNINILSFNLFKDSWAEQAHITNNHIGNNTLFNYIAGNNNIIGDTAYYNKIKGNNNILDNNTNHNNINGDNVILKKGCYNNIIIGENITFGENCNDNELKHSSNEYNNACKNINFGNYCYNNELDDSKNINFGSSCCYNNIKGNNINFDSSCSSNEIKINDVDFGNSCTYNIITGGQYISFGNSCTRNTIESGTTITLGSSCSNNKFSGNNLEKCRSVRLGDNCINNELICLYVVNFGNACQNNKFSCSQTFQPGCLYRITFVDGCSNLIYSQSMTNSYTHPYNVKLSNYTISNLFNVKSSLSNVNKYITYIRQKQDGSLVTYTDDDIYNIIEAAKAEPETTES